MAPANRATAQLCGRFAPRTVALASGEARKTWPKARNPIALTSPASAASKPANCTSARSALLTSSELGRRLNRPGSPIVHPSPTPYRHPFVDALNALEIGTASLRLKDVQLVSF